MTKREICKRSDSVINKKIRVVGTDYDRRRKLTNRQISNIKKYYARGLSLSEIARKFDVSPSTIRYHVNEAFKNYVNQKRKEYIYAEEFDHVSYFKNLAAYKRKLVNSGKNLPVVE